MFMLLGNDVIPLLLQLARGPSSVLRQGQFSPQHVHVQVLPLHRLTQRLHLSLQLVHGGGLAHGEVTNCYYRKLQRESKTYHLKIIAISW